MTSFAGALASLIRCFACTSPGGGSSVPLDMGSAGHGRALQTAASIAATASGHRLPSGIRLPHPDCKAAIYSDLS